MVKTEGFDPYNICVKIKNARNAFLGHAQSACSFNRSARSADLSYMSR